MSLYKFVHLDESGGKVIVVSSATSIHDVVSAITSFLKAVSFHENTIYDGFEAALESLRDEENAKNSAKYEESLDE